MIKKTLSFIVLFISLFSISYANTTILTWNPNTEPDLKGYKVFRGYINCEAQGPLQPLVTLGKVTTYTDNTVPDTATVACYRLLAFDESLNDSPLTDQVTKTFAITPTPGVVGKVTDLSSPSQTDNSIDLQFTEVDNGLNLPASYDIRYSTPTISWGSATSVSTAPCITPFLGVKVGQLFKCTVPNLLQDTQYQFQIVANRGTYNVDAVFGPISDPLTVRTKATVVVPPPPPLDTDGDGFPDSIDKCPTVKGVAPDGCPVIVPPPPTPVAANKLFILTPSTTNPNLTTVTIPKVNCPKGLTRSNVKIVGSDLSFTITCVK